MNFLESQTVKIDKFLEEEYNLEHGNKQEITMSLGELKEFFHKLNKDTIRATAEKILADFKKTYYVDIYGKQYFGITDDKKSSVDVVRWEGINIYFHDLIAQTKGGEDGL